jgi:hypothetical protein
MRNPTQFFGKAKTGQGFPCFLWKLRIFQAKIRKMLKFANSFLAKENLARGSPAFCGNCKFSVPKARFDIWGFYAVPLVFSLRVNVPKEKPRF